MRVVMTVLGLLLLAAGAQGQLPNQCQQQCTNDYNTCTATADQQFSSCTSANDSGYNSCSYCVATAPTGAFCPYCSDATGCPNGTPSCPSGDQRCCDLYHSSQANSCESAYDDALSICSSIYAQCSNNCGNDFPPVLVHRKLPRLPGKTMSDVMWARLMRNISRPAKLVL